MTIELAGKSLLLTLGRGTIFSAHAVIDGDPALILSPVPDGHAGTPGVSAQHLADEGIVKTGELTFNDLEEGSVVLRFTSVAAFTRLINDLRDLVVETQRGKTGPTPLDPLTADELALLPNLDDLGPAKSGPIEDDILFRNLARGHANTLDQRYAAARLRELERR